MRAVLFDIWGDYAHFRRFYTTSSPLTYSFPPPTAVRGMVGAILGMGKEEYIEKTSGLYVGIRVLNPVKRIRWGQNIVFTKGRGDNFDPTLIRDRKGDQKKTLRAQIKIEYLKNPRFRIFLSGDEKMLVEVASLLQEHRTHYTLCLGLSELLADFSYVGMEELEALPSGVYRISSVFPVDIVSDFGEAIEDGIKLLKERVPIYIDTNRVPRLYQDVIVEANGRPVKVGAKDGLYRLRDGSVIYLWPPASTHIRESS